MYICVSLERSKDHFVHKIALVRKERRKTLENHRERREGWPKGWGCCVCLKGGVVVFCCFSLVSCGCLTVSSSH